MEKEEKKYETKLVCPKCGLVTVKEESADSNKADQRKLIGLAVAGILALLLLWWWVFTYGVPLVKKIVKTE